MPTTYIWIRHADKLYSNGKAPKGSPQHDPPLKKGEEEKAAELAQKLTSSYGLPHMVVSSPYLRARQTAISMVGASYEALVNSNNEDITIHIDSKVCEYLGHQKITEEQSCPDVDKTTSIHGIHPLEESHDSLLKRVKKHIKYFGCLTGSQSTDDKVIWIVTHGIVISKIYGELIKKQWVSDGYEDKKFYPNPLDYLVLTGSMGVKASVFVTNTSKNHNKIKPRPFAYWDYVSSPSKSYRSLGLHAENFQAKICSTSSKNHDLYARAEPEQKEDSGRVKYGSNSKNGRNFKTMAPRSYMRRKESYDKLSLVGSEPNEFNQTI